MKQKLIPKMSWLNNALKKDNLTVCPNCDGTGSNFDYSDLNYELYYTQTSWGRVEDKIIFVKCPKCYGDGYIDWVNNITGKKIDAHQKFFTDLSWNCVEFSLLTLSGPRKDYEIGELFNFSDGVHEMPYEPDEWIDINDGLNNFYTHKSIVSAYLTDYHRSMLNDFINMAMIFKGQACTKCFSIVPDEINYKALYTTDNDFPLFRLCNSCNENTTPSEILDLKKKTFNQNNTKEISDEFISSASFPNIYI